MPPGASGGGPGSPSPSRRDGTVGLRRHRSHDIEPVDDCPIATDGVNAAAVGSVRWTGARQLEVLASPDGGRPVVLVETGKQRLDGLPDLDVGLVWKGRTLRAPDHVEFEVLGNRFTVARRRVLAGPSAGRRRS